MTNSTIRGVCAPNTYKVEMKYNGLNVNTTNDRPLWKDEFYDVNLVLEMGAKKYAADGWLDADGNGTSHKHMHDSMFHHLAQSYTGVRHDSESQLDHLLHVACRALMLYTRIKRGIVNPVDEVVKI